MIVKFKLELEGGYVLWYNKTRSSVFVLTPERIAFSKQEIENSKVENWRLEYRHIPLNLRKNIKKLKKIIALKAFENFEKYSYLL